MRIDWIVDMFPADVPTQAIGLNHCGWQNGCSLMRRQTTSDYSNLLTTYIQLFVDHVNKVFGLRKRAWAPDKCLQCTGTLHVRMGSGSLALAAIILHGSFLIGKCVFHHSELLQWCCKSTITTMLVCCGAVVLIGRTDPHGWFVVRVGSDVGL